MQFFPLRRVPLNHALERGEGGVKGSGQHAMVDRAGMLPETPAPRTSCDSLTLGSCRTQTPMRQAHSLCAPL